MRYACGEYNSQIEIATPSDMKKIISAVPFMFVCAFLASAAMAAQERMLEDMAALLNAGWRITSHAVFVIDARSTPESRKLEPTPFFTFTLAKGVKNVRCEGARDGDGVVRGTRCFPLN